MKIPMKKSNQIQMKSAELQTKKKPLHISECYRSSPELWVFCCSWPRLLSYASWPLLSRIAIRQMVLERGIRRAISGNFALFGFKRLQRLNYNDWSRQGWKGPGKRWCQAA
jgi:hypothetical protein